MKPWALVASGSISRVIHRNFPEPPLPLNDRKGRHSINAAKTAAAREPPPVRVADERTRARTLFGLSFCRTADLEAVGILNGTIRYLGVMDAKVFALVAVKALESPYLPGWAQSLLAPK
jgi:hypothetical protein